ncbi:MAG: inorganic phosphate transporter [Rhabdochlamydiaceae bacterium]
MDSVSILRILVLVIGLYMAWNIGANDVSNAMGTSVGSGALSLRKAVFLAAVLEFCGAFFVGERVSETVQHGLLNPSTFALHPMLLIIGMCGALLGTSLWLQIASYFGLPVSTTHAIIGAIVGFGLLVGGADAIQWEAITSICVSWVTSPILSAAISYTIFSIIQKKILYAMNPIEATKKILPLFFFVVFGTFTLCLIFNGFETFAVKISFAQTISISGIIGLLAAIISFLIVRKLAPVTDKADYLLRHPPQSVISLGKAIKHLQRVRVSSIDETHAKVTEILKEAKLLSEKLQENTHSSERTSEYNFVEKMFVSLQILSACYVAFSHGTNDVSNAIGPVAAVLGIINTGSLSASSHVPSWLLALGGLGIVVGLATWGWRVIETIGKKITALTPTRGFCAEFGAATTILIASQLGIPVSTTHCLVGSVLGIGLAKGLSAINLSTIRYILLSWVITIPASAAISILCFYGLKAIFI